jgi:hypothetical protein
VTGIFNVKNKRKQKKRPRQCPSSPSEGYIASHPNTPSLVNILQELTEHIPGTIIEFFHNIRLLFFCLRNKVSETGICLGPQVKAYSISSGHQNQHKAGQINQTQRKLSARVWTNIQNSTRVKLSTYDHE